MIRPPIFDAGGFGARLQAAADARGLGVREIARATSCSPATVSRALRGWPDLSHENYLRLAHWLDADGEHERTAA